MRFTPRYKQAGVTLTELLVVIVVIGILSTMALPVYINQAERARVAAAQQEVYEIAQAMDICGIEHGRYVPIHVLDDLPGNSSDAGGNNSDTIEENTSLFSIDFNVPISLLNSQGNATLSLSSSDPRTAQMVANWRGPFMNFQRYYIPVGNTPNERNKEDFPLDPWGNPYRFYSPVGLIGTSSSTAPYNLSDFNGSITTTDNRFDRWAIVSWGADGLSDTLSSNVVDDIVYVFGFSRTETFFEAN